MNKKILTVIAILFVAITNAQVRALTGIEMDGGYIRITSPETSENDYERSGGAAKFSIGPKVDFATPTYRLTLEGHGTYATNKNIVTIFLKDDYRARRSFGYGGSAIISITPWILDGANFTTTLGNKTRVTSQGRHGFSFGVGWENMKTFYKIPKESDFENTRFSVIYGQIGYRLSSAVNTMNLYFRYGKGENNASIWGLGLSSGINF